MIRQYFVVADVKIDAEERRIREIWTLWRTSGVEHLDIVQNNHNHIHSECYAEILCDYFNINANSYSQGIAAALLKQGQALIFGQKLPKRSELILSPIQSCPHQ